MTDLTPVQLDPKPPQGRLILVPNTLDLGCVDGAGAPDLREVLPMGAIRTAAGLKHWVVENAKSARAFLKRVDAIEPLCLPLQQLQITELPRPLKGKPQPSKQQAEKQSAGKPKAATADKVQAGKVQAAKAEPPSEWALLLEPATQGHDIGLLSEAGLPGVADPGALLVLAAHKARISVLPLAGASSLVLALAASGLNGQSFAFVGYLPQDAAQRAQRLHDLEQRSVRQHQTQLMIETPYRNAVLLAALIEHLQPATLLSVSFGLTMAQGRTQTYSVAEWRKRAATPAGATLPNDVPAVFSFLAD